jgi:hypothetical protein
MEGFGFYKNISINNFLKLIFYSLKIYFNMLMFHVNMNFCWIMTCVDELLFQQSFNPKSK